MPQAATQYINFLYLVSRNGHHLCRDKKKSSEKFLTVICPKPGIGCCICVCALFLCLSLRKCSRQGRAPVRWLLQTRHLKVW